MSGRSDSTFPPNLQTMEILCKQCSYQMGDPTVEYIDQQAIFTKDHSQFYDFEPSWFHISEEQDGWHWRIKVPQGGLEDDPTFSLELSGISSADKMRSLRHDLVAKALTQEDTDIPLRKIFPQLTGTKEGSLTPDIHVEYDGANFFFELGTTVAADSSAGMRGLDAKMYKYGPILKDLQHAKPCYLVVIIVGPKFVVSNYDIDRALVAKLTLYMSLATAFEMRIRGLGLPPVMTPYESYSDAVAQTIAMDFSSVEVVDCPDKNLNITKAFIESLKTPADRKKVKMYFNREVLKATQDTMTEHAIPTSMKAEGDPRLIALIDTLKTQESKSYQKAVTAMPLFVVPRSDVCDSTVNLTMTCTPDGNSTPVLDLWSSALMGYCYATPDYDDQGKTEEEVLYTDPTLQEEVNTRVKAHRSSHHRCKLRDKLDEDSMRELAMDGVWAKKWKNDAEKKERERLQSLPFHYDTPVDDIEAFITDSTLFDEYDHYSWRDPAVDLLRHSLESLKQPQDSLDILRNIQTSKIYNALDILSDIAMEITISLQQHTSGKDVILKKLSYYNVYLLIVTTKPSEHIFFSIYVPGQPGLERLSALPFRQMHEAFGNSFYTDFCSFRQDKLANYVTAPMALIGIMSYFSEHYELEDCKSETIGFSSDATSMVLFTLLVRLENKLATEEAITVSRYMFMEVFKSQTCIAPDPFRLLGKFSVCIRSRLQLFVVRRLLSSFCTMIKALPRRVPPDTDPVSADPDEDAPSSDLWEGLVNPYTLNYERTAGKAVSLFYIGYAVDKDQIAQTNTEYKTIQKAVLKDLEYDRNHPERSNGSWDDFEEAPKEKQFSVNTIKFGVELMQKELYSRYGERYKQVMEDKMHKRLASHMTHSLATLKASARIEHLPWSQLPAASAVLKTRSARLKVLEALMLELNVFKMNPYMSFSEALHIIEATNNGVISDLFKKNQHGGLREIYVLTIKSRVTALLMDTAARVLCEEFECEAMTHATNGKSAVIERHKNIAAATAHSKNMLLTEYQCSADKKSWNNNLVMPALAIPLLMLYPDSFHGVVQRCLNLWNERLIQLPPGVLRLLVNGVELNDPTYKILQQEFDNPGSVNGEPLFPNPGSAYCILRRGMMQGILHYTSSALHVAYLYVTKYLLRCYLIRACSDAIIIIDQLCSSDDSTTIISILHPSSNTASENETMVVAGELSCRALTTFCNYNCFTNSEKSTMGSPNQIEFNSEFIIGNSLAVPIIKWVFGAYGLTEAENLLLRQQTSYNLLGQVFSAGLPGLNTSIIQLSQGLLHYKALGSRTNKFFPMYHRMILEYPDPSLGYFLVDSCFCPGVLGFSYHHWLHCFTHKMFFIRKRSVLDGTLGFNPEGGLVDTFLIRHGDSRRYKQLVETISEGGTVTDVRDLVNSNASVLYTDPATVDETRVKLLAKSLAPGTAQSLARGNPFVQAIRSSAYGIENYCYTRSDASYGDAKIEKSYSKISLIGELARRKNREEGVELLQGMTAEELCFPDHLRFKEYMLALEPYKHGRLVPVRRPRNRKSVFRLYLVKSSIATPLYDLVKEKWFGVHYNQSEQVKARSWAEYKLLFNWLSDSLDNTLENSPFCDHVELHNFVSCAQKTVRTFVRVGPAINSMLPCPQLQILARRAYKSGYSLLLPSESRPGISFRYRDRRTSMGLALEIPNDGQRESFVKITARQNKVSDKELAAVKSKTKRDATLAIMVAAINGMDNDLIRGAIEEMGNGLFILWVKDQERVIEEGKPKWVGSGVLILCNKNLVCKVTVLDHEVQLITTNSLPNMRRMVNQVTKTLKDQNLQPAGTTSKGRGRFFLTKNGITTNGPGTPIIELAKSKELQPPDLHNLKFKCVIEHGRLRLLQIGSQRMPTTVLVYRTVPSEFDACPSTKVLSDPWPAWYDQARLDALVAEDLIITTIKRYKDDENSLPGPERAESEAMLKFLKTTLLARLKMKGLLQPSIPFRIPDLDDSDSESSEAISETLLMEAQAAEERFALDPEGELFNIPDSLLQKSRQNLELEITRCQEELEQYLDTSELAAFFDIHQVKNPPLELVTNRLTTRYGVMNFWDELIQAVRAVNDKAWSLIMNGQEAAGITNSAFFVWLFHKTESQPAQLFGRSISDQVSEEAFNAVYARSSVSRFSRRSATSQLRAEFGNRLEAKAAELLKSAMGLKDGDETLMLILDKLSMARSCVEKEMEKEEEEEERSLAGSSPCLAIEGPEESPITPVSKVRSWLELGPGPNYEEQGEMSLLGDEELSWLFEMLKERASLDAPYSLIAATNIMKGTITPDWDSTRSKEDRCAYFIHLGSAGSGHWVSVVTGFPDGRVEYYDTSSHKEANILEAYEQLSRLVADVSLADFQPMNVQPQTTPSCGHACFMRACHRLCGWDVPLGYTDRSLRKWVSSCIKNRELVRMETKYTV